MTQNPLWWELLQTHDLPQILGMTCCKLGTKEDGGNLQLGGRDPAHLGEKLESVPVTPNEAGYWSVWVEKVTFGQVTFNGSQLVGSYGPTIQTIIDSGNDQGFKFVTAVSSAIEAELFRYASTQAGILDKTCITGEDVANLIPDMTIIFGSGAELQISGYDWLTKKAIRAAQGSACPWKGPIKDLKTFLINDLAKGAYTMLGSPMSTNNNLGQGVLANYYTEFNKDAMTVSFARQKTCPTA